MNYFPKNIYENRDIPCHNSWINDKDLNDLQMKLHSHIEENEELKVKDYYCSYAFDDNFPMGTFFAVRWFKKDIIEKLVSIENKKSQRIFPRYIPNNLDYEDIEKFCLENHSYFAYLEEQISRTRSDLDNLKRVAEENDLDFEDLLNENPGISTPDLYQELKEQYQERTKGAQFSIPTQFLEILTSDPLSLDIRFQHEPSLNRLFKTVHPFLGKKIPPYLETLHFPQPKKKTQMPNHEKMVSLVTSRHHKGFVHDFLQERYVAFIEEYTKLSRTTGFSYAQVWELKEKYLKELYELAQSKQLMRTDQIHRAKCRDIAKKLWKNDPTITIADMILEDEINGACEGIVYTENTLRNWIKDLCPDRKPGRRPKKTEGS